MKLLWLEYFCKIAACGNMSQAAQELHISQPALSKTLGLLEAELGVPLFARVGRNIQLNEVGYAYYLEVSRILDALNAASQRAARQATGEAQRVTVKIHTANLKIAQRIVQFQEANPHIPVVIQELDVTGGAMPELQISSTPDDVDQWETEELFQEELVLIMSDKLWSSPGDQGRLVDFRDKGFVFPREDGELHLMRHLMEGYCAAAGFLPKIVFETCSPDRTRMRLLLSDCVSIIPISMAGVIPLEGLRVVHISDMECKRSVYIMWRKHTILTENAKKLVKFLKEGSEGLGHFDY